MTGQRRKRSLACWLLLFMLLFQGISATPAGLMFVLDLSDKR